MRLSIVNYGLDTNADIPKFSKKEDDELIKIATEIIRKYDFGTGAAVVSEVFHTDLRNSNNRKYVSKGMDNSVTSFYNPHFTPFLMHHDMGSDPSLVSVGTNIFSKYTKRAVETPHGKASGYGKVVTFVPSDSKVGEQSAISALRSRRLLTVSLGARVSDNGYLCSICRESLISGECDHIPGKEYEGQLCVAEVHNPLFREYSAVYNPSDIYAAVRRMDVMENEGDCNESHVVDSSISTGGYISIYDSVGRKVVPSAGINNKEESTMKNTEEHSQTTDTQETTEEQSVEASIGELVNKYEKQLKEKNDAIVVLSKALGEKIDEIESLRKELTQDSEEDTSEEETTESEETDETSTEETEESTEEDTEENEESESTEETETSEETGEDTEESTEESSDTDKNDEGSSEGESNTQDHKESSMDIQEILLKRRRYPGPGGNQSKNVFGRTVRK